MRYRALPNSTIGLERKKSCCLSLSSQESVNGAAVAYRFLDEHVFCLENWTTDALAERRSKGEQMSNLHRILCPIDLSMNSLAAIKLATTLAKESDSKIVFLHVTPLWLPDENYLSREYVSQTAERDRIKLEQIRPTDPEVPYEHVIEMGNAGPKIVSHSETCDCVVMSTHGYGAFMRLLMGSVAQYVGRHAKCPVIMFRNSKAIPTDEADCEQGIRYVTEAMHHSTPVSENDEIEDVLVQLETARQTAAPVINEANECIGILTETDIAHYHNLVHRTKTPVPSERQEKADLEKNESGCSRNAEFSRVKRHMSSPVITISNNETTARAAKIFSHDAKIHHLVVIDEANFPLGIIKPSDCETRIAVEVSIKPARSHD